MNEFTLTLEIFLFLFAVGFVSGLVDSIAGGGGLIALPALLFLNVPPQIALGTNKLQGTFGTLSAAWNYTRNGQATLRDALPGVLCTLLGASMGAWLVQLLDPSFIKPLIPILLLFVFFYMLFTKQLGVQDRKPRMGLSPFYLLFGLLLGFYDGFFGPGTGSFWTMAFMLFAGFNITKATGHTKIMNFTSNIVALIWFILGGNVCYSIGLTMAGGQVIGARVGSSFAMKNGAKVIRPIFMTVVFLTIIRLVYVNYIQAA